MRNRLRYESASTFYGSLAVSTDENVNFKSPQEKALKLEKLRCQILINKTLYEESKLKTKWPIFFNFKVTLLDNFLNLRRSTIGIVTYFLILRKKNLLILHFVWVKL